MDLWVVAAATGAGYVAKYWRNLTSKETETSFSIYSIKEQSESRNLLQQIRDQTNPLRGLASKHDRDGFFQHEEDFNDSQRQVKNNENFNLLSLTSFPRVLADNENFRVIGNGMEGKSNLSDVSGHLRSRYHGKYIEPLDSVESNLRSQLYSEYVEIEEYVYNSVPSESTPAVRPLLLTDGHRIISRASPDFRTENEMQLLSKKLKNDIRRQSRRFSMMRESVQPFNSQGLNSAKLRFFLGISVGIMSTIVFNNREVENLNEQLTKTENLVQDLQELLEMKDLLNLKEIANEDLHALGINQHQSPSGTPYVLYTQQELDVHSERGGEEPNDQKAEKSEAMSKIEAELVAELERLELNMRNPRIETISDSMGQDPDFIADVVHGDLKLDQANGEASGLSDSDCDVNRTSRDHLDETNYAVSPRELSLRLHKVIQSRLEERIMELEMAFENSQRRLHSMELESIVSWRDFYGEVESTSQESQYFIDEDYNDNDSWL